MRILIVKPKHIGDTLLLTPTLVAIHEYYPEAELWVVVRRGCQSILAGCPFLHRVLTLAAVDRHERHWTDVPLEVATWLKLLSVHFDYVFELGDGHRGRLIATTVRSEKRFSVRPANSLKPRVGKAFTGISTLDWDNIHRVEKDFRSVSEFLTIGSEIPQLHFDRKAALEWEGARGLVNYAVMQIGKRQTISRWPKERWLAVAKALLPTLDGLIISTGPAADEVAEAEWLATQLRSDKVRVTAGKVDWPQMAGLLYRARYYVGVDTAAMHLAAACKCPVVAIFGPTWEQHWTPWKHNATVLTGGRPAGTHAECKLRAMTDTSVESVVKACLAIDAKGR